MEDRRQAEALFRYSLIRELADPGLGPRRRGVMTRALAELEHAREDGRRVRVSPATLRRWLRQWRAGGFAALLPGLKLQPNRTPAEVLEAAVTLKREAAARTAAQVARILVEAGVGKVSGRTLQRHFVRLGLNVRPDGRPPDAYGRFEAGEFGELWTGDGLHGPVVAGATAVLLAFIDDFSRAVVGWRWGQAEDTVRLEAAFRRGLESAGVPRAVFVDRGSAFVSAPFHRTLATLGIRIVHSRPGHAREGRTLLRHRPQPVPGRAGGPRRRPRPERAQRALRCLAGRRLSPHRPQRDGPDPAGAAAGRRSTAPALAGRAPRRLPVVGDPAGQQDRLGEPVRRCVRG